MPLRITPTTLKTANNLIEELHRHHKPVRGHRFSLALYDGETLCGVCVVGRPVSREIDQELVAEVTRLVTDGTKNACSKLYGAAARVAKEMGFLWIQTYILNTEPGTSLIASGWTKEYTTKGGSWNCNARQNRREDQPLTPKTLYKKTLNV